STTQCSRRSPQKNGDARREARGCRSPAFRVRGERAAGAYGDLAATGPGDPTMSRSRYGCGSSPRSAAGSATAGCTCCCDAGGPAHEPQEAPPALLRGTAAGAPALWSLDGLAAVRGCPAMCVSDNGTELTSMAVLRWSQENRIEWHYIAPGKPQQNAFAESFIGRL